MCAWETSLLYGEKGLPHTPFREREEAGMEAAREGRLSLSLGLKMVVIGSFLARVACAPFWAARCT
jgi:hypothetical protein